MIVDGLTRKSEGRAGQLIGEVLKLESKLTFFTFSHVLIMAICQKAKHHKSLNTIICSYYDITGVYNNGLNAL